MEGPFTSFRSSPVEGNRAIQLRTRPAFSPRRSVNRNRSRIWLDLGLILSLIFVTAGVRVWTISHTAVAARDSIGFIRYALALENQPWAEVFRNSQQHPGYPLVLLLVSWPLRAVLGGINATSMQLSAQIASGLASTLLVVPTYLLGKYFF